MKRIGQINWCPLFFICILISFVSCEDEGIERQLPPPIETNTEDSIIKPQRMFVWVDQLNVRKEPNMESEVVIKLAEGAEVIYENEKSENEITATLRGKSFTAPFYKIKTKSGLSGWIFSAALTVEDPDITDDFEFNGDTLLLWEKGISSLLINNTTTETDIMNFGKVMGMKVIPEVDPMSVSGNNQKILLLTSTSDVSKNFRIHFDKDEETIIEKIVIDNKNISDQYGVRVGDKYRTALSKRKKMTYGINNRGITYAVDPNSRIVYQLLRPPTDENKTLFTEEESGEWKIEKIIWFRDLYKK